MSDLSLRICTAVLCFFATMGGHSLVLADAIDDVPKETLSGFMELSVRDNTRVLAPARAAFEKGDYEESRRLLERAFVESGIVPHPGVQMASWLLSTNNSAAALRVIEAISVVNPDRPDVRWMFAEVARQQGRLFDAWTHINFAVDAKLPSQWEETYAKHMMGLIRRTQASIADQRGDYEVSERLFKALLKEGILTTEVDMALGRSAFFLDRPDEAFKYFQRACKPASNPTVPELLMAAHFEQTGEPEKAEEWFKKGDAKGKLDAERIRLEYAMWLLRRNRSADARKVATKYSPSKENLDQFKFLLAQCERMNGNFQVAEKLLSPLNLAAPNNFAFGNELALVLIESTDQGKLGRAMQIASSNVRKFRKSADAIATYGWIQHRTGESAAAEQTFNVLLQGGQVSRDTAFYLAQLKYALNQKEAGDKMIEAAKSSEGQFYNAFRVDEKL